MTTIREFGNCADEIRRAIDFLDCGMGDAALDRLSRISGQCRRSAYFSESIGRVYAFLGRAAEAEHAFRQAAESGQESAWEYLIDLYESLDLRDRAVEAARTRYRISKNVRSFINLLRASVLYGDRNEVVELLDQSPVIVRNGSVNDKMLLAHVFEEIGYRRQAKDLYESIIESDTDFLSDDSVKVEPPEIRPQAKEKLKDLALLQSLQNFRDADQNCIDSRVVADIEFALAEAWTETELIPVDEEPIIVLFHVEIPDEHPIASAVRQRNVNSMELIRSSILAAHRWLPGSPVILCTDLTTPVPDSVLADRVVRLPLDAHFPVYERMKMMYAFVRSPCFKWDTFFLDTDIAVNSDLSGWRHGDFDVAAAYRPGDRLMPINEGAIMARPARRGLVRRFFERCMTIYNALATHPAVRERYPYSIKCWRGGQLSLGYLAGWPRWTGRHRTLHIEDTRVRLFRTYSHNYTFSYAAGKSWPQLYREACDRQIVHFKGERKADMVRFIEQRLRASDSTTNTWN